MKISNDKKIKERGYRIYRALLDQSGVDAPVATVIENDMGRITWSRVDTGIYLGTAQFNVFQNNATILVSNGSVGFVSTSLTGVSTIRISTNESNGAAADDKLVSCTIEIKAEI